MVQELQNMRFAYEGTADPKAKANMASIIIHRSNGFNLKDEIVPTDLRDFIEDLRRERASQKPSATSGK